MSHNLHKARLTQFQINGHWNQWCSIFNSIVIHRWPSPQLHWHTLARLYSLNNSSIHSNFYKDNTVVLVLPWCLMLMINDHDHSVNIMKHEQYMNNKTNWVNSIHDSALSMFFCKHHQSYPNPLLIVPVTISSQLRVSSATFERLNLEGRENVSLRHS